MRALLVLSLMMISFVLFAQEDRAFFSINGSIGVMPVMAQGMEDVSNSNFTHVNDKPVTISPEWKYTKNTYIFFTGLMHLGFNLPIIKKESWSTGFKFNLGLGVAQPSVFQDADLSQFIMIDLPQFIYFRSNKNTDISILAGYRLGYAMIQLQQPIIATDFGLGEDMFVRVYGTPFSSTVYNYFTDGRMEPALKVREFGVGLILGL